MKSRTSYFNKTIFLKNLTRFAPAWGLYTVGALMCLILLLDISSKHVASNLIDVLDGLSLVTPCYALLCTQLLFGDLYNTRMCNALHALPLTRETWFVTNVISGFVFHLIPTLTLTVLVAPVLALYGVENSILAAPIFLVGTNLQFACYFGLAVFCGFCVGNRFAQSLLYAIVNFGSIITGWLIDTIFVPMYYGIQINTEPFQLFSPMVQMASASFTDVRRIYETEYINSDDLIAFTFHPDEGTVYYFAAAAIGIALLFFAMRLYRRRKLECAGDFLAIKGLEPAFLVVYSIILGAVFHFCANEIVGMDTFLFLFIGLAVGWFTGKMLLERSPRVFRKKNILRCGILLGICGLTIAVALMDPLGIEDWLPDADNVESVTISDGPYRYSNYQLTLENPEDISRIIAIHEAALVEYHQNFPHEYTFETAYKEFVDPIEVYIPDPLEHYSSFTISYKLANDRTVRRYYRIWLGDEHGRYLKQVFSSPEAVFGYGEDLPRFLSENSRVIVRDTWHGLETQIRSQQYLQELYRCLIADCAANKMAQPWTFHSRDDSLFWIYLEDGSEISVFSSCTNTLTWLRSYGLDVDELIENYGK